jgi:hypothetical protein
MPKSLTIATHASTPKQSTLNVNQAKGRKLATSLFLLRQKPREKTQTHNIIDIQESVKH